MKISKGAFFMNTHTVTATEANRTLSDILNKVHYQGQTFEIKRGKEIIAKIVPMGEKRLAASMPVKNLKEFFKSLPSLDREDLDKFEEDINKIRSIIKTKEN